MNESVDTILRTSYALSSLIFFFSAVALRCFVFVGRRLSQTVCKMVYVQLVACCVLQAHKCTNVCRWNGDTIAIFRRFFLSLLCKTHHSLLISIATIQFRRSEYELAIFVVPIAFAHVNHCFRWISYPHAHTHMPRQSSNNKYPLNAQKVMKERKEKKSGREKAREDERTREKKYRKSNCSRREVSTSGGRKNIDGKTPNWRRESSSYK